MFCYVGLDDCFLWLKRKPSILSCLLWREQCDGMILLGLSAVKELFIAFRFKAGLLRSRLFSHHNVLLKMEKNL